MQIDAEKFNAVKELSEINMLISEGRASLALIKKDEEKYLSFRENVAHERIAKVLNESREYLEEISKNQDGLVRYKTELKAYATSLKDFAKELTTLFEDFIGRTKTADEELSAKCKEIEDGLKEIKIQRTQIFKDQEQLARDRDMIHEEKKALKDSRETLERAWAEFKSISKKQ